MDEAWAYFKKADCKGVTGLIGFTLALLMPVIVSSSVHAYLKISMLNPHGEEPLPCLRFQGSNLYIIFLIYSHRPRRYPTIFPNLGVRRDPVKNFSIYFANSLEKASGTICWWDR
jgi:hypothetical protein